jgi:hypothetical protein
MRRSVAGWMKKCNKRMRERIAISTTHTLSLPSSSVDAFEHTKRKIRERAMHRWAMPFRFP